MTGIIDGRGSELQGRGWVERARGGGGVWHVRGGVERLLQSLIGGVEGKEAIFSQLLAKFSFFRPHFIDFLGKN